MFISKIQRWFRHDSKKEKSTSGKSDIQGSLKTYIFKDVRGTEHVHMAVNYFLAKKKNSDFYLQFRAEMYSLSVGHGRAYYENAFSTGKGVSRYRVCEDRFSGNCAKCFSSTLQKGATTKHISLDLV
jgi:hypothetical protein